MSDKLDGVAALLAALDLQEEAIKRGDPDSAAEDIQSIVQHLRGEGPDGPDTADDVQEMAVPVAAAAGAARGGAAAAGGRGGISRMVQGQGLPGGGGGGGSDESAGGGIGQAIAGLAEIGNPFPDGDVQELGAPLESVAGHTSLAGAVAQQSDGPEPTDYKREGPGYVRAYLDSLPKHVRRIEVNARSGPATFCRRPSGNWAKIIPKPPANAGGEGSQVAYLATDQYDDVRRGEPLTGGGEAHADGVWVRNRRTGKTVQRSRLGQGGEEEESSGAGQSQTELSEDEVAVVSEIQFDPASSSPEEVGRATQAIFGAPKSREWVASLGWAVNGADVNVTNGDNWVRADVTHPQLNYEAITAIRRSPDGGTEASLINAHISQESPLSGKGAMLFAVQVGNLARAGVGRLVMQAAGNGRQVKRDREQGKPSKYVGYKVWPRYGVGGEIPEDVWERVPPELQAGMGDSRDILDLYDQPGGPEWWVDNGSDYRGTFDLSEGSRSRAKLKEYIDAKGF